MWGVNSAVAALNRRFASGSAFLKATGVPKGAPHVQSLLAKLRPYGLEFDRGGWLMPGMTLAVNNTGRPERIVPANGGGTNLTIEVNINALDGASVQRIAPELVRAIRRELAREMV